MSIFSSYKKIFLLGFIIVILIAIPFSVYIAQQRQQATTKASAATTLSFEPEEETVEAGDILTLDIVLDPEKIDKTLNKTPNQISFVKLSISFDPEKFTTTDDSLAPSKDPKNTLESVLEEAVYDSGKAFISLSIGADPTRAVTTKTKIAVLKLKTLSATSDNSPSEIKFDTSSNNTQVLSLAASDQTSENVLSTTTPATVTINSSSPSPTPTLTPTNGPTPTPGGPTLTPTPTSASTPTPTLTPTPSPTSTPLPTVPPATPTLIPTFQPIPTETLPPTGPGDNILGIGIIGTILTLIGGVLFILL